MIQRPKKKSIETIQDELSRLPVRVGDVWKYKDGTLYWVSIVSSGAGSVRGNYFVQYTMVLETEKPFHFIPAVDSYVPKVYFTKEIEEFCESMTMYSGSNSIGNCLEINGPHKQERDSQIRELARLDGTLK